MSYTSKVDVDRMLKTIKYLERRIDSLFKRADAIEAKHGGDTLDPKVPIKDHQLWVHLTQIASELSIVLTKLDDRGKPTKLAVCPECGWETAAKTPRGRIQMIKKHSEATGHTKFDVVTARRPEDLPF